MGGEILTNDCFLRNTDDWPFQNFYEGKYKLATLMLQSGHDHDNRLY